MKRMGWVWLVVSTMAFTAGCDDDEPDHDDLPSCADGVLNGDEEGTDCGGACAACIEAPECMSDADCNGGRCVEDACVAPLCGDGIVHGEESCDDGPDNSDSVPDACRTDCRFAACGDGVQDADEDCDHGPDNSDSEPDGCRTDCRSTTCGDAVKDSDEGCDDGNEIEGDGCTGCVADTCGDGIVNDGGAEACDDGPLNSDIEPNACRTNCTAARCGDLVLDADEACDDGNTDAGDGCTDLCLPAGCGDGIVRIGVEDCDDGVDNSDSEPGACRSDCRPARCGDATRDADEACDDGSTDDSGACLSTCVVATCGDAFQWVGVEDCDDGNGNPVDSCQNDCRFSPPSHVDQTYIPTASVAAVTVTAPAYQTFTASATGLFFHVNWWAGLADGANWDGAHYYFELREGAGLSGNLLASFESVAAAGGQATVYATTSIPIVAGTTYSLVFWGTRGSIRASYSNGYPGCSTVVGPDCASNPYDIFFSTWLRY